MIVVTGATGNVGRPLVAALVAAGERVVAVSRGGGGGASQAQPLPAPVRAVAADLAAPDSLKPVLDGADALFLLVPGGGEALDPGAVLDAVLAAGVRRVVLQSSQAAGTRPDSAAHGVLRAFEDALRDAGVPEWTVLRPGGFASNAFQHVPGIREHGTLAAPFADTGLPVIDPADIAGVAATVLRADGHTGRTYVLTGPALVTPREQAAAIGAALGGPVRFVEQSPDEAREQLGRFMPPVVVDSTLAILGEPTAAEREISPAVADVLGRPPGTFAAWAQRNAPAFR